MDQETSWFYHACDHQSRDDILCTGNSLSLWHKYRYTYLVLARGHDYTSDTECSLFPSRL